MNEMFSSDHRSNSYSSYVEAGRLFKSGSLIFQPYTSLEYMLIEEEAFTESGGGPMVLRINDASREQLVSNIGVRTSTIFRFDKMRILPEISIAWRYYMNSADMSTTASFVAAPNEFFTINGGRDKFHALDLGAALKFLHNDNFNMNLSFNGELLGQEDKYDVQWKLEYKF